MSPWETGLAGRCPVCRWCLSWICISQRKEDTCISSLGIFLLDWQEAWIAYLPFLLILVNDWLDQHVLHASMAWHSDTIIISWVIYHFFLFLFLCVMYDMYVCGMCTRVYMCVWRSDHTQARGGHQLSCSTTVHFIPMRQELGWWPVTSNDPLVFFLHNTGVPAVRGHTNLVTWGFELRPSHLAQQMFLLTDLSPVPMNITTNTRMLLSFWFGGNKSIIKEKRQSQANCFSVLSWFICFFIFGKECGFKRIFCF